MSLLTFEHFLRSTAADGGAINTLFEERLFELAGLLHRIAAVFSEEGLLYELVGGLAVLIHVEEVNPELTSLRDQVHIKALDAASLITPAIESNLPAELAARLRHVRETE